MSSLLFRHNLSPRVVENYLRGYPHDLPVPPEDWAKAESLGLPVGSLVACLEMVSQAASADAPQEDEHTYKVNEVGVVVGSESERPIIVSIGAESYELTFLENVMTKRANDARITGWDFCYLIVEPTAMLSTEQVHGIEQLGLSFARGGSRRERGADGTSLMDPAIHLLSALGLEINSAERKKVLELGAFCHTLFEAGEPPAGSPFANARATFRPVPRAGAPAGDGEDAFSAPNLSVSEAMPAAQTSPEPQAGPAPVAPAPGPVAEKPRDEMQSLLGLGGIFSFDEKPSGSSPAPAAPSAPPPVVRPPQGSPPGKDTGTAPTLKIKPPAGPAPITRPGSVPRAPTAPAAESKPDGTPPPAVARSAREELSRPAEPLASPTPALAQPLAEPAPPAKAEAAPAPEPARPAPPAKQHLSDPAARADSMDPLVAKLEQQVTKATSKLVEQVERIHSALEGELANLVRKASEAEDKVESNLAGVLERLRGELNGKADDAEAKVADAVATGRYSVKQLMDKSVASLDSTHSSLLGTLTSGCEELKSGSQSLAAEIKEKFESLVKERATEIDALVDTISSRLKEAGTADLERLQSRFEQQRLRMGAEEEKILKSFESHLASLQEDIDGVCERAREKLKSTMGQFEQTVKHTAAIYELDISRTVKSLVSTVLTPNLREHRNTIKNVVAELDKNFQEEAGKQIAAHLNALDERVTAMRQELQDLLSESVAQIEGTGQDEQSRLAAIFTQTSEYLENALASASQLFQEADEKVEQSEKISKELVDMSSTGAAPALIADRDSAVEELQGLKQTACDELFAAIEKRSQSLEEYGQKAQAGLAETRERYLQSVREAKDQALKQVRDLLQDSFAQIHATREKYLE